MQPVDLGGEGLWAGLPAGGLQPNDDGVRPWRLPVADLELFVPTQATAHHERSSNSILTMAGMCSGVRLVLGTDAHALRLVVRPRQIDAKLNFDLVADGRLLDSRAFPPQQTYARADGVEEGSADDLQAQAAFARLAADPVTVDFAGIQAGGAQTLELWLPHRAAVTVMSLEVNSGAAVAAPLKDSRPRWITHGSSITHGIGGADNGCAHGPARTWPGTAARLADVNLVNLGLGGQCHFDQAVARVIRDEPAELLTLKLGINVHNLASLSLRTFATAALGFVMTVRDGHPLTPIVLVSPIYSADDWRESTSTGSNRRGDDGVPLSGASWPTLQTMREDVKAVVELLRKRGDANIYYRDGLELL